MVRDKYHYDLTFNWNIINRKKRKQNITRDIEVKNNLTMDRGEWGGDSEESFFLFDIKIMPENVPSHIKFINDILIYH